MEATVDILLATYKGARFVEEQVQSLLNQTYPHFHIWIRDDGSPDQTPQILHNLSKQYPKKITLLPDNQNKGAKGNFGALMTASKAPFMMFSDQDDWWFPNKIEVSLNKFKELEKIYGSKIPLLVHTNLTVVESNLSEIDYSFWKHAGINPNRTTLNYLLNQNVVTGCTMMINRSLLQMAQPLPEEAIMHDWWLTLVASAFGQIGHLETPTILYRQHESNDIGAKSYKLSAFLKRRGTSSQADINHKIYAQAQAFLTRYTDFLRPDQKNLLESFISLEKLPFIKQKQKIIRHKFYKHGFLRNLKHLLTI